MTTAFPSRRMIVLAAILVLCGIVSGTASAARPAEPRAGQPERHRDAARDPPNGGWRQPDHHEQLVLLQPLLRELHVRR